MKILNIRTWPISKRGRLPERRYENLFRRDGEKVEASRICDLFDVATSFSESLYTEGCTVPIREGRNRTVTLSEILLLCIPPTHFPNESLQYSTLHPYTISPRPRASSIINMGLPNIAKGLGWLIVLATMVAVSMFRQASLLDSSLTRSHSHRLATSYLWL
jgi:hypothetical protein